MADGESILPTAYLRDFDRGRIDRGPHRHADKREVDKRETGKT